LNDALRENCAAFARRFPELAGIIGLDREEGIASLAAKVPEDYALEDTASGSHTLRVGASFLHSRYNPVRDAERELTALRGERSGEGCVFAGVGLAYLPERYAREFPRSTVVLVEPDLFILVLMLASRPLSALFAHEGLIILAGTQAREVATFLESTGLDALPVHEPPALTAPNRPWFDEFAAIRKRNRERREINANTLKRFGDLWLKNMCKNLSELKGLPGIGSFAGILSDVPVLVLAAGPSLDRILPKLPRLRERCVIIAVDTALRATLRAGIEPDFIVLVDPQYWNWRHLDGLSCPHSVLITESAAWPAVFRFKTRATCLCSSLFPLGKFLEARTAPRGELGAGGSVSTTAWDFARHLGATRIFMAGLDLGFPDGKTHFTGSIFEERTHVASLRLAPAETAGYHALYGAGPYPVSDYAGNPVLTDKRLILYAWWFESRLAAHPANQTATLTPEGVRIPGFKVASVDALASGPETRGAIDARIAEALSRAEAPDPNRFHAAVRELTDALAGIARLATEGIQECDAWRKAARDRGGNADPRELLAKLDRIDRAIAGHPAKEVAAMVFQAASGATDGAPGDEDPIAASRRLYRLIIEAAEKNSRMIEKFA
jgi:hypothetical protein